MDNEDKNKDGLGASGGRLGPNGDRDGALAERRKVILSCLGSGSVGRADHSLTHTFFVVYVGGAASDSTPMKT